jgi:transcriptional regulator with XRE-family HTH domain
MRAIERFGKQLQRLRTGRGLTQEELAVNAGLARVYLNKLESGQHDPSLSTLVRLAKVLKVSVTELLGEAMSATVWWQVGEQRFSTRAAAEEQARSVSELFVARYQNKPEDPCAGSFLSARPSTLLSSTPQDLFPDIPRPDPVARRQQQASSLPHIGLPDHRASSVWLLWGIRSSEEASCCDQIGWGWWWSRLSPSSAAVR